MSAEFSGDDGGKCIGCDNGHSRWGLMSRATAEYTVGSGILFQDDNFGGPLAANYPTDRWPTNAENVEAYEGAASLFNDSFGFAQRSGVGCALGIEVPLGVTYPQCNGTEAACFEGIFTRLARLKMPIAEFWLYSSEGAMGGANHTAPLVQQIIKDAATAKAALASSELQALGVKLCMSGWMLGPADIPEVRNTTALSCLHLVCCANRLLSLSYSTLTRCWLQISG